MGTVIPMPIPTRATETRHSFAQALKDTLDYLERDAVANQMPLVAQLIGAASLAAEEIARREAAVIPCRISTPDSELA